MLPERLKTDPDRSHPVKKPVAIALLSWVLVASCIATVIAGDAGTPRGIAPADIPGEIATANARLDQLLAALQRVPDISDPAMTGIAASLNEAIGKITNASNAYLLGNNVTVNATIIEALALLDALEPEIDGVIARHLNQKATEAGLTVFGIILAVVIVICLVYIKQWHDKRGLDSFLAMEIDYTSPKEPRA
nr:hypothetical protein [Candidatus Sigynarchaeota archaeon]